MRICFWSLNFSNLVVRCISLNDLFVPSCLMPMEEHTKAYRWIGLLSQLPALSWHNRLKKPWEKSTCPTLFCLSIGIKDPISLWKWSALSPLEWNRLSELLTAWLKTSVILSSRHQLLIPPWSISVVSLISVGRRWTVKRSSVKAVSQESAFGESMS